MPKSLSLLLVLLAGCSSPDTPEKSPFDAMEVPAGARAAGPRLSAVAGQPPVLSWMEPDETGTTLWYSVLADSGWQPRRTVVAGRQMFVNWADMPSVSALDEQHWVAQWLEMAGALTYSYHIVMAQSFDAGRTWSESMKPHTDGTPTEHGFVSVYPFEDRFAAIWLDGRKTGGEHGSSPDTSGMTLRSAVIDAYNGLSHEQEVDDLVCDCCQTDVAVTSVGPVAVYRNRTIDEIRDIYVSRLVDGEWQKSVPLHEDNWRIAGCPVNGPAIAARGAEVAVAWFAAPQQAPAVRVRFSKDGGATFGPATMLAGDGALGHVDVALLEDGSAVVSWLQADAAGYGNLVLRRVTPGGKLGPVVPVGSNAPARSVPQLARAGSDLVLVWTEAREDAKHIVSARIPVDSVPVD